ncbi:hypothetical protein [Paenibacillus albus]|uniref:DUF402 domain-containing protein n=1 Tax=Paenibacillus albus TaxID=2495582 RepID=A0A3Q8X8I4_9BACL|nr:hypothetical protein [Paenibacillus albus]AZN42885.1 hypothetical protein EJC50_26720 [Paenibacillus albus]
MDLRIFWNHVGREHGGLNYTDDIRKNAPEVIQQALELKVQRARGYRNRFIRYDESTLIELPAPDSRDNFIIIYCIDRGLQFSMNFKPRYLWWLIDVVEIQEVQPGFFCVYDLFIDIAVNVDGSYQVMDMDEFEYALSLGVMTSEQVSRSLKSLHSALTELNSRTFPDDRLKRIHEQYMKQKVTP